MVKSCAALFLLAANPPLEPTFQNLFKQVLESKCTGCHDKSGFMGVDLSSYEAIIKNPNLVRSGDPESSLLYDSIVSGRMPLGYRLEAYEVDLVREWIRKGAKNDGDYSQ